jgi:ubiquitin-protein ligase
MDKSSRDKISGPALKRLQKEFKAFAAEPPEGLRLTDETLAADNLAVWLVRMEGPANTLYQAGVVDQASMCFSVDQGSGSRGKKLIIKSARDFLLFFY